MHILNSHTSNFYSKKNQVNFKPEIINHDILDFRNFNVVSGFLNGYILHAITCIS